MAKQKSPYRGYSLSEVTKMEMNFFVIRFGGDFVFEDGCYTFTRNEAIMLYDKSFKDLVDIARTGNVKDSKYALELMASMSIQPMRLQ